MAEPIYLQVGDRNTIYLPDLVGAIEDFYGLLKEVDSTVADRRGGNLNWTVSTLQRQPFPLIGVTPSTRRAFTDSSRLVETEVINNVVSLTERGERNKYLSDAGLRRVERLALTAPKLGPSAIYIDNRQQVVAKTLLTVQTLNQVQELTSVKFRSYGNLTGSLGSISVHKGKEFRVWDEHTNAPVRCSFNARQEPRAKELLGKQVIVSGLIFADRNGRPLKVNVEDLDEASVLDNLPSIDDVFGLVPNFTGGLSLLEFLEDV